MKNVLASPLLAGAEAASLQFELMVQACAMV